MTATEIAKRIKALLVEIRERTDDDRIHALAGEIHMLTICLEGIANKEGDAE